MARTKTSPGTAPSAAHAAPDTAPAPGTAPADGSPAAAVHAALAASPGSAVAVIAGAAGTGTPAARAALLAMEKAGTATRVKAARPGIPDTWTLAGPTPDAAGPHAGQAGQPGENPDGSPDDATGDDHEDAVPGEQGNEAAPVSDPGDGDAPADVGGESGDEHDPALVTDLTGHLGQIKAAADAAGLVLTANGDLRAVLAGLDEIAEQAAQARRSLKAAIGGRKTPAVRPGGLRDKVLAHLDAHRGAEFTPHEIHKVLGHSSGAIANALETLVRLGDAEVATEKPRRFRRAVQPAEAVPEADGADSAERNSTDLAGAA